MCSKKTCFSSLLSKAPPLTWRVSTIKLFKNHKRPSCVYPPSFFFSCCLSSLCFVLLFLFFCFPIWPFQCLKESKQNNGTNHITPKIWSLIIFPPNYGHRCLRQNCDHNTCVILRTPPWRMKGFHIKWCPGSSNISPRKCRLIIEFYVSETLLQTHRSISNTKLCDL